MTLEYKSFASVSKSRSDKQIWPRASSDWSQSDGL